MLRRRDHSTNVLPLPVRTIPSDRELVQAINSGDIGSLGRLYDRYANVVFALACASQPADAESILENVFARVWELGRISKLSLPLLPTFIDLIAQQTAQVPPPIVHPLGGMAAREALPVLAPFVSLDTFTLYVFLLVRLGGLNLHEIGIALEADQDELKHALAKSLRLLDQGMVSLAPPAVIAAQ